MDESSAYRAGRLERGDSCGGATEIGPVRVRNEDAFWISEDASVLIVADGLGGLPAGDVASTLAVAAAADFLAFAERPRADPVGPGDATTKEAFETALSRLVHEAAARAQHTLLEAVRRHPALRGMATTLVVILVEGSTAAVLQVGDSRAALWRGRRLAEQTIDQNVAGDLLRRGTITADEARVHPSRNLVREVVGLAGGYQAECRMWTLEPGDVLLVMSDGVTETVTGDAITEVLETASDALSAAASLVRVAAERGSEDNATAIVRYVT